jgi:outer membrane biosynthesis protein TonB
MNSPRSGFRRAAAASWALSAIGVAGVAGASALAYADTVKPAPEEAPAVESVTGDPGTGPVEYGPPVPEVGPTTDAPLPPPPPAPEPAPTYNPEPVTQAPVETYTPRSTPAPQYTPTPKTAVQQAPVQQAPASQPAFPIRTNHTPSVGRSSPNFSPPVTRARGS